MRHIASALFLGVSVMASAGTDAPVVVENVGTSLELVMPATGQSDDKQDGGRFAVVVSVDDSPAKQEQTHATSQTLDDGTLIWTVAYRVEGAEGLSLLLRGVSLTADASLTVFRRDGSQASDVLGSLGDTRGTLPTDFVRGEEIVLQYIGPSSPVPSFVVEGVSCAFKNVRGIIPQAGGNKAVGDYGSSATCESPATCSSEHDDVRRAVCRILTYYEVDGLTLGEMGSGILVNNTAQDGRPYVLSAAHIYQPTTFSTKFWFGFEEHTCDKAVRDNYSETIVGSKLVSYDERSDMMLLELSASPTAASHPFWAGWSLSGEPQGPFYCFHHPYGDSKKVSYAASVKEASYAIGTTTSGETFRTDFHWEVPEWQSGITEIGSSGSGLVDADGCVIGALTGGKSSCTSPKSDYFWQLRKAWDIVVADSLVSLSSALDPLSSGVSALKGADLTDGAGTKPYFRLATYDGTTTATAADKSLSADYALVAQRFENPLTNIDIKVVSLPFNDYGLDNAKEAKSLIAATVVTDLGDVNTSDFSVWNGGDSYTIQESTKLIREFTFKNAFNVTADHFYVVFWVSSMAASDYLQPFYRTSETGSVSWSTGGTWNTETGHDLLTSVYYQDNGTTSGLDAGTCADIAIAREGRGVSVRSSESLRSYTVRDLGGRVVSQCDLKGAESASIDLGGYPTGLYFVTATTVGGESKTLKTVVANK